MQGFIQEFKDSYDSPKIKTLITYDCVFNRKQTGVF